MAQKPRSAEMHPGPGFRVRLDFPRPRRTLMDQFTEFPTPDISDLLNRLYALDPQIRCLTSEKHQLCGPACTVKVFPGDNLMVHKSLDVAKPGDVVVVDAGASPMNAVLGDLVCTKARQSLISRGLALTRTELVPGSATTRTPESAAAWPPAWGTWPPRNPPKPPKPPPPGPPKPRWN